MSYFYDEDEFRNQPNKFKHVPADTDIKKYVAGSLTVRLSGRRCNALCMSSGGGGHAGLLGVSGARVVARAPGPHHR